MTLDVDVDLTDSNLWLLTCVQCSGSATDWPDTGNFKTDLLFFNVIVFYDHEGHGNTELKQKWKHLFCDLS